MGVLRHGSGHPERGGNGVEHGGAGTCGSQGDTNRVAASMTLAATLRRRRRKVANSAVTRAETLGMASWMRHMSQNAEVCG